MPPAPAAGAKGFDQGLREELELQATPGRSTPYPAPLAERWGGVRRAILPGQGVPGPGCGRWVPTLWCAPDLLVVVKQHRCEGRGCPSCAGRCPGGSSCPAGLPLPGHGGGEWAHREAELAGRRLEDYLEQHDLARLPLRQVMISVDLGRFKESDDHDRVVGKMRAYAERALRRLAWQGRYGGSLVVHLDRGCEAEGYDRWGPHAHAICFGVDVGNVDRYARQAGVVVKQVNRANGGGFASYRGFGLYRHLVYELGHSAVVLPADGRRGGNHSLTWFGVLKTWKQPPDPPAKPRPCPRCGSPMEPLTFPLWSEPWAVGSPTVCVHTRDGGRLLLAVIQDAGPPEDEENPGDWVAEFLATPRACVGCSAYGAPRGQWCGHLRPRDWPDS